MGESPNFIGDLPIDDKFLVFNLNAFNRRTKCCVILPEDQISLNFDTLRLSQSCLSAAQTSHAHSTFVFYMLYVKVARLKGQSYTRHLLQKYRN
jgi:hypothetical protein